MKKSMHFISVVLLILSSSCVSTGPHPDRSVAAAGTASEAIPTHVFHPGETFLYDYDNTDTEYCAEVAGAVAIAKAPLTTKQIKIPVKIEILSGQNSLSHKLTLLPEASYRSADAATLGDTPFQLLAELIEKLPPNFGYSYADESWALSHLFNLFGDSIQDPNFMSNPLKQFFFFKMQDIHQMQASALGLKSGLAPGGSYVVLSRETPGLGGKFIGGNAQYLYVGTEYINGVRAALVRVNDLGNQFSMGVQKAVTNFTFTMYIALEGPAQGLLISGSGQETAYPIITAAKSRCAQPVLQRQFSIHLK